MRKSYLYLWVEHCCDGSAEIHLEHDENQALQKDDNQERTWGEPSVIRLFLEHTGPLRITDQYGDAFVPDYIGSP